MKLSKGYYRVLLLTRNSLRHQDRSGTDKAKHLPKKVLDTKLTTNQQCHYGQSGHQPPGLPQAEDCLQVEAGIAPLCSAFEGCSEFPSTRETWTYWRESSEGSQMIKGLKHLLHEKLGELGLCSLGCCHRIMQ